MSQSLACAYIHIIFSTKDRAPLLKPDTHDELERFITTILNGLHARLLALGGMPDHLHLLIELGRRSSIETLLREVKSRTSAWLRRRDNGKFNWQSGYGVFSVSPSHLPRVISYITHQTEHHSKRTFQEEYEAMLLAAGMEYDREYLWSD